MSHGPGIGKLALEDRFADDGGEEKLIEQVDLEASFGSPHGVPGGLGGQVVSQVVSWHKGADRMPVGQGQQHLKESVQAFVVKDGGVNGVVGDHRHGEGDIAGGYDQGDPQTPILRVEHKTDPEEQIEHQNEREGSSVGRVLQQGDDTRNGWAP